MYSLPVILKFATSFYQSKYFPQLTCKEYFFDSSAIVSVEIKNKGEDAFKPEIYGDMLIIERRITEATSSTILKDCYGYYRYSSFRVYA